MAHTLSGGCPRSNCGVERWRQSVSLTCMFNQDRFHQDGARRSLVVEISQPEADRDGSSYSIDDLYDNHQQPKRRTATRKSRGSPKRDHTATRSNHAPSAGGERARSLLSHLLVASSICGAHRSRITGRGYNRLVWRSRRVEEEHLPSRSAWPKRRGGPGISQHQSRFTRGLDLGTGV